MFRRGRHRAHPGCVDHLRDLATAKSDLKWMSGHIERLTDDLSRATAQLRSLQQELGTECPTEPLPVAELRDQIRRNAPEMIKAHTVEGFTIMLPVGSTRARHVRRPSWALRD